MTSQRLLHLLDFEFARVTCACAHAHAYTHTRMHTHTHMHTHMHTHTHTHMRSHSPTHLRTQANMCTVQVTCHQMRSRGGKSIWLHRYSSAKVNSSSHLLSRWGVVERKRGGREEGGRWLPGVRPQRSVVSCRTCLTPSNAMRS